MQPVVIEPLVPVELLKTRLLIGEDALVDTDNLKQALISAEQLIAGLLRTDIRKKTAAETFYVDKTDLVLDGTQVQLQTRNGFISNVQIQYKPFISAGAGTEDIDTFLTDVDKGVLTVPFSKSQGYFSVIYTSGYDPTEELPEWLVNLILLGTEIVYNLPSNGKEDRGTSSSREQIDAIISEHNRLANRAVKGLSYAIHQP